MESRQIQEVNYLFLANELWLKIFSFLSIRELAVVSEVCWQFNQLANENLPWLNQFPPITHSLVKKTQQSAKSLVKSYSAHQPSYGKFFNLPGNNYFPALMSQPTFKEEIEAQIKQAKPQGGAKKDFIGIIIGEIEADKKVLVRQAYSEFALSMVNAYCFYHFNATAEVLRSNLSISKCIFLFSDSTQEVIKQIDTIRKFVNTLPMIFIVSNNKEITATIPISNYPITEVIHLTAFKEGAFWMYFSKKLMQLTNTPLDDMLDRDTTSPVVKTCNMM